MKRVGRRKLASSAVITTALVDACKWMASRNREQLRGVGSWPVINRDTVRFIALSVNSCAYNLDKRECVKPRFDLRIHDCDSIGADGGVLNVAPIVAARFI